VQLALEHGRYLRPTRPGSHGVGPEFFSAMMRCFASGSRPSSAKQSMPPDSSTNSDTQRMPEISGSFHSSK
jgi:hypothetical protein